MSESTDDPTAARASGTESADGKAQGAGASEQPRTAKRGPAKASKASEPEEREIDPNAYHVELPQFEGPLDLLLHLIQKHELDILDIPIGFIAKKYVEYLNLMEALSIDVASEYLVMAATLAHIKSKSLLPPDPNAEDDDLPEEEEDPRAELIRRLLEYQKYKQAAEQLGGRSVLGRDVFPRGVPIEASTEPAPLAQISLFKLVDAFEEVLKRAKHVEDHLIDFERISITEKIGQVSELLRKRGRLEFVELFPPEVNRVEMIVTFLALLEMTKLRMTFIQQDDPMGPIYIELRVTDDDEPAPTSEPAGSDEPSPEVSDDDDVLAHRPRESMHRPTARGVDVESSGDDVLDEMEAAEMEADDAVDEVEAAEMEADDAVDEVEAADEAEAVDDDVSAAGVAEARDDVDGEAEATDEVGAVDGDLEAVDRDLEAADVVEGNEGSDTQNRVDDGWGDDGSDAGQSETGELVVAEAAMAAASMAVAMENPPLPEHAVSFDGEFEPDAVGLEAESDVDAEVSTGRSDAAVRPETESDVAEDASGAADSERKEPVVGQGSEAADDTTAGATGDGAPGAPRAQSHDANE